jgi:hypothetical protein
VVEKRESGTCLEMGMLPDFVLWGIMVAWPHGVVSSSKVIYVRNIK